MNPPIDAKQSAFKPDLTSLNEAERHVLLLLSQGHTVKSIAAISARSVAAVNERLRSARRKTGIGSSRELARLLRAQENRDDKTEVVRPEPIDDAVPEIARHGKRSKAGSRMMLMSLSGALIAAVIGLAVQQGRVASDASSRVAADPELYNLLLVDQFDAGALHDRLLEEPRIADWASRSEDALRKAYSALAQSERALDLKVRCGATLCEVTSPLPMRGEIPQPEHAALERALQAPELGMRVSGAGLVHKGTLFTGTTTTPARPIFVSFWSRQSEDQSNTKDTSVALPREERGQRGYYKRVREEVRDPLWYSRTQAGVRELIGELGIVRSEIRVNCAATLCEVAVFTPAKITSTQTDEFFERLQSPTFQAGLDKMGLKGLEAMFRGSPGGGSRTIYITYLLRTKT